MMRNPIQAVLRLVILWSLLTLGGTPAVAQESQTADPSTAGSVSPETSAPDAPQDPDQPSLDIPPGLSVEHLEAQLQAAEADKNLSTLEREQAKDMLTTAKARINAVRASMAAQKQYQEVIQTSSNRIRQLNQQLLAIRTSAPASPPAVDESLSLEELDEQLQIVTFEQAALRGELAQIQNRIAMVSQRQSSARQDLVEATQALSALEPSGSDQVQEEESLLQSARRSLRLAEQLYWPARVKELQQELMSLPRRLEILSARRRLEDARLSATRARHDMLAQAMDAARQALAQQHLKEAENQLEQLGDSHPALQAFARQSITLSQRIADVTRELASTRQTLDTAQSLLLEVQAHERNAEEIIQIGDMSESFGQLLVALRAKLPPLADLRRSHTLTQAAIVQAKLAEFELITQRDALAHPAQVLAAQKKQLSWSQRSQPELTPQQQQTFDELVAQRWELITLLSDMQDEYLDELMLLSNQQQELLSTTQSLALRLDERLIWLPSTSRIDIRWFSQIGQGIVWLLNPAAWLVALKAAGTSSIANPLLVLAVVVAFVGMLSQRWRMRQQLAWIAEQVGRVSTDRYYFTPQALGITLAMSLPWALLMGTLGWMLQADASHLPFTQAVGRGFLVTAILLALLNSFRVMCQDQGLFDAHFNWSADSRKTLGSNLHWLIYVECVSAFVAVATRANGGEMYQSGLGRLAFFVGSLGLALFMYRVFHPSTGMEAKVLPQKGWIWKSRGLWFSMIVLPPVILALLAGWGYYQTAAQIQSRLFTTAWVVLVGLILYSLAMRFVVVAHRRLAVRRAREAREKASAAREASRNAQDTGEAVPNMLDLPDVNLSTVSDQTRTILRWITILGVVSILWMVWSQLVPALGVLNDITLWNGTINTQDGPQPMPITLLALLTGLITAALTIVAAKNLPGLLEITAISRLSFDSGTRYAITAISRYVIVVVGFLLAFDQIGLQWSKMQWIVAALGVGLGFGLQEIVANFVSGLIILFERPVRVGDTVTVNDLSGTISRIQIRATTIVDWDNREILVPNKSFITENVVNWTLSDPVTRLVMKVGIAYGSDTALAHKLMLQAVKENPTILQTPAPTVFFLGFGASSLDFEVRIFVSELVKRMAVLHELHMAINKLFAEHGIEIPFPQMDLHIRSSDVKWPLVEDGKTAEPAPKLENKSVDADKPEQDGSAAN